MADTKNYNPVYANHVDKLDEHGHELCDPTPVEIPVDFSAPPTLAQQILEVLRSEQFRAAAVEAGAETFEEANDFEVEDYEPTSPYELSIDQELDGGNPFSIDPGGALEAVSPPPPAPGAPVDEGSGGASGAQ